MEEALFQRVVDFKKTLKVIPTGTIKIVPVSAVWDKDDPDKIPACPFKDDVYNPGFTMQGLLENDLDLREAHLSQLMFPG